MNHVKEATKIEYDKMERPLTQFELESLRS